MWVFSPLENTVKLKWNREIIPILKGINEITPEVGEAYFLFGKTPQFKAVEADDGLFDLQKKIALQRWGTALSTKPPEPAFLCQFLLADKREKLEELIEEQEEKITAPHPVSKGK